MSNSSPLHSSMERLGYDRSLLKAVDNLSSLEKAIKYSNSKIALQRLVVIREFIDICHEIGFSNTVSSLLPVIKRLSRDSDEDVRRGALSILGDFVGFLVQSEPEKGYKTVISGVIPIIRGVLMDTPDDEELSDDDDNDHRLGNWRKEKSEGKAKAANGGDGKRGLKTIKRTDSKKCGNGVGQSSLPSFRCASISVKEVACQTGITLCSHLRHSDRIQYILSIGLALANDLENEDSRCLSTWMLNGLAEYVGRDVCRQYIIPQMRCLGDDHSERVRRFAAMNLCEIIRINKGIGDIFPTYKRLILHDTYLVRLCAIKVLLGISSSIDIISERNFFGLLLDLNRDCTLVDNIRIEYLKQLGPLITLFPEPENVPDEILDLYLTMDNIGGRIEIGDYDLNTSPCNSAEKESHTETSSGENVTSCVELNESRDEVANGLVDEMFRDEIRLLPFGNQLGLTFGQEDIEDPAYFCSFSFAAVFSHMGSLNWDRFCELLSRLVDNPRYEIRLPIAASISLILANALYLCESEHENNSCSFVSLSNGGVGGYLDSLSLRNSNSDFGSANQNMDKDEQNNTINKGVDLFYNISNNNNSANSIKNLTRSISTGSICRLTRPCSCKHVSEKLKPLLLALDKLLLDENVLVKRAILGCLSDIVKCLPFEHQVEAVFKKLSLILGTCKGDWRSRNILAIQIRKICIELHFRNKMAKRRQSQGIVKGEHGSPEDEIFTGWHAQEYISPVAFSLILDPVSTVRLTAINCISSLLRLSSPFIWNYFQNGGNLHDLPFPIHPPSRDSEWIKKLSSTGSSENSCSTEGADINNNSLSSSSSISTLSSATEHQHHRTPNLSPSLYPALDSKLAHYFDKCPVAELSCLNESGEGDRPGCGDGQSSRVEERNMVLLLNEMALIWCILKTFAISTKYHHRQEYIKMCDRFIRDIPRGFFNTYFLNPLILLTSDPVRNVRSTWLRIMGPHVKESGRLAQCGNIVTACMQMNLSEVDSECIKNSVNIKTLNKSKLKRVDLFSVKDISTIIERTSRYDDVLNWNQQPLIKCFNLYLEEVVGSLWCLDNIPGCLISETQTSSLQGRLSSVPALSSSLVYNYKKPYYSNERCSDLTMEHEMMLMEVRPNSSPAKPNLLHLDPVITSDIAGAFGTGQIDIKDVLPDNSVFFRPQLHRRALREYSECSGGSSDVLGGSAGGGVLLSSDPVLYIPGIYRGYDKFTCPIGTDNIYNEMTGATAGNDDLKASNCEKTKEKKTDFLLKLGRTATRKQNQVDNRNSPMSLVEFVNRNRLSLSFDHKLREATRNVFMVDITRAAADDLF